MRMFDDFDTFFFDFDGLLVDTEPLHYKAYCLTFAEWGYLDPIAFDDYIRLALSASQGIKQLFMKHLKGDWHSFYERKKQNYEQLLLSEPIRLMPGVREVILELEQRKKQSAIVTNSTKKQIDTIARRIPLLKKIPFAVTREAYENPKPAPDAYLKAIELYSKPDDRIIGFEDSLKGLESLISSNVTPVLICAPTHPQLEGKELPKVLHVPSFHHLM